MGGLTSVVFVDMVEAAHAARIVWETTVATWRSTYIERRQAGKDMGHTLGEVAQPEDIRSISMRAAFTYIDRERAAMVSAESVSVGKYRNQQRSVHLQKATQHRFFIRQGQSQQLWNDLSLRILATNASVHP